MRTRLAVVFLSALLAATGSEAADTRHAGTVVEVDPAAGHLTIEEMAPGSRTRRIDLRVEPTTRVLALRRLPVEVVVGESARTRDIAVTYRWVEQPLELSGIRAGDFAVVEIGEPERPGEPTPANLVEVTGRVR